MATKSKKAAGTGRAAKPSRSAKTSRPAAKTGRPVAQAAKAPAAPKKGSMFVRNATGLVRELTAFDAFNLVFAAILIPVGISQALNFGAAAFPGANVALAFVLGGILLLGFGGVYVYFTLAMPRSGGDYVWVSRALHPFLGFVVNVTLTFVFVNCIVGVDLAGPWPCSWM